MSGIVTGRINRFFIESSLDRILHSWESAMNCSTVMLKVIKDEISCRSNTIEISVLFEDIWLLVKPVVKRLSQQFNISSKLVRYCIIHFFILNITTLTTEKNYQQQVVDLLNERNWQLRKITDSRLLICWMKETATFC